MSFFQLRSPRIQNPLANPAPTIPTVTTQAATGVGTNSATGNGTLVATGGATVTALGFVWATHSSPTLADNVVTDAGTALGTYADSLTGLPSGTQIYYDAYATNSVGTAYGGDQTFTTSGAGATTFSSTLLLVGVG